jgi:hypothetical protein
MHQILNENTTLKRVNVRKTILITLIATSIIVTFIIVFFMPIIDVEHENFGTICATICTEVTCSVACEDVPVNERITIFRYLIGIPKH